MGGAQIAALHIGEGKLDARLQVVGHFDLLFLVVDLDSAVLFGNYLWPRRTPDADEGDQYHQKRNEAAHGCFPAF
jgi:hypothetical protein